MMPRWAAYLASAGAVFAIAGAYLLPSPIKPRRTAERRSTIKRRKPSRVAATVPFPIYDHYGTDDFND